jgi:hypothetical protein
MNGGILVDIDHQASRVIQQLFYVELKLCTCLITPPNLYHLFCLFRKAFDICIGNMPVLQYAYYSLQIPATGNTVVSPADGTVFSVNSFV